ncbi:MAG: hypothetical protein LUD83_09130 [Clostridiales bacterium]|nr:hypothetical protein [Clostridiales bacterium]
MTTIIKIRKGVNGFRYSACDSNGYWICNANKLSDIRRHWKNEIKAGAITLVRELDQQPDMTRRERGKQLCREYLAALAEKGGTTA